MNKGCHILEGEKQAVELAKNPDALVHLVEKTAALVATAVQAGQVLSPDKNGHVFMAILLQLT